MSPADEPREAWILTHDGEKVDCLLERVGPHEWQATPVRDVDVREIAQTYIDLLPADGCIGFVLVGPELL